MFGTAKPAASLSSGLLARKGQARPAMRPQGFVGLDPGTSLDDLGWNDMGHEAMAHAPAAAPVPPVLAQRQALAEEFTPPQPVVQPQPEPVIEAAPAQAYAEEPAPRPVSTATAARIGREVAAKKGKAAFTLRLDTDRHLKLRLASALSGRSAQLLVTEALDAFLETLPEVGALANQLPAGKAR
ncbi:hypothetical protein [Sphingomonas sp. MS122]|uniref:hypothetical protein n=1 Tax=Sphingomonas sp. MS122 TaxID=3412683 RepID=UPI003C2DD1AB